MYRTLVPIDGNEERATSQARTVCALPTAAENVEVTLLHVFDDRDTAETTSVRQLPAGRRATEILVEAGVPVTAESATGNPAEVILDAAERIKADHIVMGGRTRGTMGSLLFGSVSREVSNETDLPVTIAGDSVRDKPSHVCETCGERYFTDEEIVECRNCGGVQVVPPPA
jgi:nucleotide-binding universal stress UspA family protein